MLKTKRYIFFGRKILHYYLAGYRISGQISIRCNPTGRTRVNNIYNVPGFLKGQAYLCFQRTGSTLRFMYSNYGWIQYEGGTTTTIFSTKESTAWTLLQDPRGKIIWDLCFFNSFFSFKNIYCNLEVLRKTLLSLNF